MIVAIIAVLIGLLLIGAGGYYFIKEKSDKESRKIYMITMLIGVIIVIGALVKIFCLGNTYQKSPIPQWLRDLLFHADQRGSRPSGPQSGPCGGLNIETLKFSKRYV